jgi:hypothetical protein
MDGLRSRFVTSRHDRRPSRRNSRCHDERLSHAEFVAMGKAEGGGSGWATLAWSPRDRRLINCWAADHTTNLAGGQPISSSTCMSMPITWIMGQGR